jgi:hypothetical protein
MLKKIINFVLILMILDVGFVSAQSDGNGFKYLELTFEEASSIYIDKNKYEFILHWTKDHLQKRIDGNGEESIWVDANIQVNYLARMLMAKANKRVFIINIRGYESLFIKINDNEYLELCSGI